MKTVTVEASELRRVLNSLLQFLDTQQNGSFELHRDVYWISSVKDRYNPYEEPTYHRLGQLFDDWENLKKLDDPRDATGHHLVEMSSILRYIGELLSGEIEVE